VSSLVTLYWSLTIILTRFDWISQVLEKNEILLGLVGSAYVFAFVYICVYVSLGELNITPVPLKVTRLVKISSFLGRERQILVGISGPKNGNIFG
jgi:hypothetical protein